MGITKDNVEILRNSWGSDNDGAGSGLDADTLDGMNSDEFVAVAGDIMTGSLALDNGGSDTPEIILRDTVNNTRSYIDQNSERFRIFQAYRGGTASESFYIRASSKAAVFLGNSVSIAPSSGNGSMEIGRTNGSSTPYIDFHSGSTTVDYDSRIIASGGDGNNGNGVLDFYGNCYFKKDVNIEKTSPSLYLKQTDTTNNYNTMNFRLHNWHGQFHLERTDDADSWLSNSILVDHSSENITFSKRIAIDCNVGGNLSGHPSIAIGDTDTGLRQNGDGVLELFSNNQMTFQLVSNRINAYKTLDMHSNNIEDAVIDGGTY